MSGYFLYQSSRLESFPERFPSLFLQKDPLSDPVYIIVQNSGLGEWLVRFLTERQGAVMGPRVLMPEQALRRFASGYPAARKLLMPDDGLRGAQTEPEDPAGSRRGLLFMDGMKLTVFKALEEVLQGDNPVYSPLQHYMASSRGDAAGGERLWQLTDALAGIFYHYGMNCLPLVEAWDRDSFYFKTITADSQVEAEAWQRGLWRRIFSKDAPYTHLSRVLSQVMESGESYNAEGYNAGFSGSRLPQPPTHPARVILFGSMFLGETGLRFFRYLAADFEVHHFILTPSRVFAFSQGLQGELFDEPAGMIKQPFLRNNARLSAGFAALLPSLAGGGLNAADKNWENPGDGGALLHQLRASLIDDMPFKGPVEDDGSLELHNVSGPRRAVEVLKDRILEALRDDETLSPTQIGVLAPDISRYAPYIESIFPSRISRFPEHPGSFSAHTAPPSQEAPDHLNFNLTDLPSRSEAPFPSAFKALMELPGSRFGRAALTNLFSNPCFTPSAGNPETEEAWRRIVETLHIRWGVDEEQRHKEGAADIRTGAWETAFERLLAGYYHDEDDRIDILPAMLSGDGAVDTAGDLMHVIRTLNTELRPLDGKKLSLKEWTLSWERIVERWLSPRRDGDEAEDDQRDRLRIKGAIRDLLALDEDVDALSDFSDSRIPWTAFSSLLEEMTNPSSGRRGRYLSRGVTCASLKPTRAIPFRRIYILGLDEGAWPGREFLTGFDLRDKVPKFIDLSRESVDRFALLEAIFSASEHLSLFYSGRDPERGNPLAPAAPLVELLEHLGEGARTLIRRHPLNPFHPLSLSKKGKLATSSSDALALGEVLYQGLKKPAAESRPLPPDGEEESVDWQTLARFLKNPVEYFFLRRLGTARESAGKDSGEDDVLEAEFLEWWNWCNTHALENPEAILKAETFVADFRRRLKLEGSVSRTPAGEFQAETWENNALELASALEELIDRGLDIGEPFSCRFVPGLPAAQAPSMPPRPESGCILNLPSPQISFKPDMPENDTEEHLHITGTLGGLRFLRTQGEENPEVWTMLEFISAGKLRFKHKLRSWTAALMIAASMGENAPGELRVYRLNPRGGIKPVRRYFFRDSNCPGVEGDSREEEIVPLYNAFSILRSLVKTFREGESSPLALYPDLADKLILADKKYPIGENLEGAAAEAWNSIIKDSWNSSVLKDCYYRQNYLKKPDFSSRNFARAWEKLYLNGGLI